MNPEDFKAALAAHCIELSPVQANQFDTYYRLLVQTNEHVNLTTIVERDAVYLKHFYDSITPALYFTDLQSKPVTLCDVGAGAGFPSLPLKILFPQLRVTIVDSLNKRIAFLNQLVEELGLSNVQTVHARAEEYGGRKSAARESFDLVTARAVARMSVLAELCLPLVKVGGTFVALKAAKAESELSVGQQAIATLGGELVADHEFSLPVSNDERNIVIVKKVKSTPKQYPRKAGTPNKKPIGE